MLADNPACFDKKIHKLMKQNRVVGLSLIFNKEAAIMDLVMMEEDHPCFNWLILHYWN